MIRAEQVGFSVATATGAVRAILQRVSFVVERQGLCLVTGPTGAGKSTLLHLIAGVLRPTVGEIWIGEQPISRLSALHRDRARRAIGLLPQKLHLIDWLDVRHNVELPLLATGSTDRTGVARLLEQLDVAELSEQPVGTLSGGERQRAALARALSNGQPVLVLDEPTAHQDDHHAARVLDAVASARTRGATVVVASHDPRVEKWARDAEGPTLHLTLHGGEVEQVDRLDSALSGTP